MSTEESNQHCPICYRLYSVSEIEYHVNKCIFLNSASSQDYTPKRKRPPSPVEFNKKQKRSEEREPSVLHTGETHKSSRPTNKAAKIRNNAVSFTTPITEHMQPKSLPDLLGQDQVLGKNTFLRSLLEESEIPNIILWGPPGCGKTSLANVIGEICRRNSQQYKYISISAVNCGINEVRDIVTTAKKDLESGRRTVVFLDEIHRFNKRQQKSVLIHIMRGDIVLVGATTENPSFTLNNSLLNCCKVIVMEKLETHYLISIIERALAALSIGVMDDENTIRNMYQTDSVRIHRSAIKWLADTSDGDARIALNNLQLILQHTNGKNLIKIADIKDQIKKSHLLYDRDGEEHHNIISAMHESIKGYNDNAALYWATRMIAGGEDPLYIARRLIRASSEDTGNADPKALRLAVSTMHGCEAIGRPEADVLLAQCAIYLTRAPTNKQTISALTLAKKVVSECQGQQPAVPVHLQDIPLKLLKDLGDSGIEGSKKSFMPQGLENVNFL